MARATGTRLVFRRRRDCSGRGAASASAYWCRRSKLAATNNERFAGFTFHLLRHTAGSLMASFGMDPASAAERLGHTDGGALFLRTYRHLYEGEKRAQAERFGAQVQAALDEAWTDSPADAEIGLAPVAEAETELRRAVALVRRARRPPRARGRRLPRCSRCSARSGGSASRTG